LKKTTEELLSLIQNTQSIDFFLKDNQEELQHWTLDSYLNHLLNEKQLKIADVVNRSQQSDYIYKVFKNQRKPSRDILIAIALGMKCSLEETQNLLRIATVARLDPRNQKDAVLIYAVLHQFSVTQTNDILYDLNESTL